MEVTAIFVSILVAIFAAIFFPLFLSGKRWRAAQERVRARRMVDAKMNARLLRFNL